MRLTIPVIVEMTDEQAAAWAESCVPREDLEISLIHCILRAARREIRPYYGLVDAKAPEHVEGYTWAWELPDDTLTDLQILLHYAGRADADEHDEHYDAVCHLEGTVADEVRRRA